MVVIDCANIVIFFEIATFFNQNMYFLGQKCLKYVIFSLKCDI